MRQRMGWAVLCSALAFGCGYAAPAAAPASERTLTLLHTSDIHSRLWPFRSRISGFEAEHGLGQAAALEEVGGVARLATLLARERGRGDAVWLDSGDALEGAEVFERYGGRLELELLSSLGLAAMALGNHELSLEPQPLAQLLRASARFPVLAANLQVSESSPLQGLLAPSAVIDVGGVALGVVGVANQQSPPSLSQPGNGWGLGISAELARAVQLAIDDLAPRAALVVVLSHLGLDADRALVRGTTGIALLLGGHQHILTAEPEWQDDCGSSELREQRGCAPRQVPIIHSGAYGQWLTRLTVQLAAEPLRPDHFEVRSLALTSEPLATTVPEDPSVAEYLAARRPAPEPPLAFLAAPLRRRSPLAGDSTLGNFTADAMRRRTQADVLLLNSSGLREDLEPGVLLRSDLELAFPFAEPWRLTRVTGRALRRGLLRAAFKSAARDCESTLQVAGLHLRIRCAACRAQAAQCLEAERVGPLGTLPLDDAEWLWLALPEYLTLGGADFEDVAGGSELEVSVPEVLGQNLASSPPFGELEPCVAALGSWSEARCGEAFSATACPVSAVRARAVCAALPELKGEHDGRIEMLP
jgi:5'-nucleotidase / UDP-sugar diphosphatase